MRMSGSGALTRRDAVPLRAPEVAVIVVVPCATAVAMPLAASMVAINGLLLDHVNVALMGLPAASRAVAVNVCVPPINTLTALGPTVTDEQGCDGETVLRGFGAPVTKSREGSLEFVHP